MRVQGPHAKITVDASVKPILFWSIIVIAALVIGFAIYRSRSATDLNVTPDARREIEKAMRR